MKTVFCLCKPFDLSALASMHECRVATDGTVRIYCPIAGDYRLDHSISELDLARIRAATHMSSI